MVERLETEPDSADEYVCSAWISQAPTHFKVSSNNFLLAHVFDSSRDTGTINMASARTPYLLSLPG